MSFQNNFGSMHFCTAEHHFGVLSGFKTNHKALFTKLLIQDCHLIDYSAVKCEGDFRGASRNRTCEIAFLVLLIERKDLKQKPKRIAGLTSAKKQQKKVLWANFKIKS